MFSFQTIVHNLPILISAARYTLLISVLGCAQGLVLGAVICAASLARRRWRGGACRDALPRSMSVFSVACRC